MIAVYPGTFDPFTNGHYDLLKRSTKIFDDVIVAVAESTTKKTLFSTNERLDMVSEVVTKMSGVDVVAFDGLLVNFAESVDAKVIIRGLRAVSDFEYEFQLAAMNRNLADEIETMFLTPAEKYSFLSSAMIKDVVRLGGDASAYLHPKILDRLKSKYL